ncbi:MAG: tetratricopeptide repeat protein [Candidatus Omnitrophota bacterium]|nr:tetratricopeptide repeat protein [Candidatus Omnitrophota bacterium]
MKKIVATILILFTSVGYLMAQQTESALTLKVSGKEFYLQGKKLCDQGRYDDALVQMQKAIEVEPENATFYIGLGSVYAYKHMHNEEIDTYKKAIKLDPKNATAHYALGVAYGSEEEKAVAEYQKAVEIEPDFVNAHFMLGVVYYKKAKEHLEKARALGKEIPGSLLKILESSTGTFSKE